MKKKIYKRVTVKSLQEMKDNAEKISMLTSYDFTLAGIVDKSGIDVILVGDSASNIMAGHETTLPITLDQMIYHASSVIRAVERALVVVDLPFGTYQSDSQAALESAIRIMKESGSHAVKLEGGKEIKDSIKRIIKAGIPVMGHLGLTPQSIYKFGTYSVRAKQKKESDELIQAYRLYTLALAEKPALGAMNRMKEMGNISNIAQWRLAGAYSLIGKEKIANDIISKLNTDVKPYQEMRYSYGSSLRDQAMILEILTIQGDKITGKRLFDVIAKQLSSNNWYNTQTTAYSLLGLSKFIGNISQDGLNYELVNNGAKTKVLSEMPIHKDDLALNRENNQLKITNNGNNIIFIKVKNTGVPLKSNITEDENNLSMNIKYLNMKGEKISPYVLDQGTDFIAEVVIKNTSYIDLHQLALSQMFPSGWEIRNTRMDNISSSHLKDRPDYQDFRDDRVYSYFNLSKGQTKTFRIILNASYIGEFFLPITYCEAMYDNEYFSRKAGGVVKVIRSGGELTAVGE